MKRLVMVDKFKHWIDRQTGKEFHAIKLGMYEEDNPKGPTKYGMNWTIKMTCVCVNKN